MISSLWLLARAASAGGYFYSESGIVSTGRGGAWIAGADTQFAQYHNPAGLIRLKDPTLTLGWSAVQQRVDFTRQKPDGTFYPEIHNQASPFDVPEGGFSFPFGDRLVVAVGFYSPYAPSSLYDEEGPQRYSVKDTSIYQFSVGPSAAFQLHDMLVVGLGLQWQYLNLYQSVDVTATGVDDPAGDIAVEAKAVDAFTPNLNAGLLIEPHKMVTIGLAMQPPTSFRARGSLGLDFEGNGLAGLLDETKYEDADTKLDISIPWVLRAGVAVRPIERLEIETAVVWQDWSSLSDITIEDIDIDVDPTEAAEQLGLITEDQRSVQEQISLPAGLKDTVSLRLGAELDLHERLAVRAGGFYEGSAVAKNDVSVALMETPKVQLGFGATAWAVPRRLRFDAAFAYLLFKDLEIRDSTVTQIDAGVFDDTVPLVIGNGDLASRGWVVGVAASVAFPRKAREEKENTSP